MRPQFDIPHLKKQLVDHSSSLVCISMLTCMAGQREPTVFPKTELQIAELVSVYFRLKM